MEQTLTKFHLYSTKSTLYLVGRSKDRSAWRILKFAKNPEVPTQLEVFEDPVTYSERECASLLTQIGAGNAAHGGITLEVTVRDPPMPRHRAPHAHLLQAQGLSASY
jgi:hypothetical protein